MPIREKLSYHLDNRHKRSFVTYPYLYINGDGNIDLLNKVLKELIENNSQEDICIIPFLGERRGELNYDTRYGFDNNSSIQELNGMISRRYDYVIENNIYSLCETNEIEMPFLFLLFDETVDRDYIVDLMKDAKRLGIFIICIPSPRVEGAYVDFIVNFSEMIFTQVMNDGRLAVQGIDYKYALLLDR